MRPRGWGQLAQTLPVSVIESLCPTSGCGAKRASGLCPKFRVQPWGPSLGLQGQTSTKSEARGAHLLSPPVTMHLAGGREAFPTDWGRSKLPSGETRLLAEEHSPGGPERLSIPVQEMRDRDLQGPLERAFSRLGHCGAKAGRG